jgi:hypothetical protein
MIQALDITKQVMMSASWHIPTTITASTDLHVMKALQAVNFTGMLLGRIFRWRWLYKRGVTDRLNGEHKTGDADVTNGSKFVTSSSTVNWTEDMKGRLFKAVPHSEQYRIEAVEPAIPRLTLTQPFNGTTAADTAYKIAQDEYLLPTDFDLELNILQFKVPQNLTLLPPAEFNEVQFGPGAQNPVGGTGEMYTGDPVRATIGGVGDDDRLILVLDPPAKSPMQIVYDYYGMVEKFTRDDDTWPYPQYLEPVIHDGALHYIRLNAQDDSRAAVSMQEFIMGRAEVSNLEPMDAVPRLQPDTGRRRQETRLRRRRGRTDVDWGTLFDRGLVPRGY